MATETAQDRTAHAEAEKKTPHVRVAIVGTGFSGLGLAIKLKQRGMENFVILERANDIGGTWRDNTYPGCACDVPSHLYSFSFAPNPDWSRHFSPQREIWAYLRDCAERFGLARHILLNHELLEAAWDEDASRWRIQTSQWLFTADVLALGNGPLSEPSIPAIPGLERFKGTVFHSAQWNHEHDLTGERVAVIGTGASAIQFVPQIQPQVKHLTLFQRTPPWIIPRNDHAISPERARPLPPLSLPSATRAWWHLPATRDRRARPGLQAANDARRGANGARTSGGAGRRSGTAREADAALPDGLQAHPALRRLLSRRVSAERRGRHRARARGH